MTIVKLPSGSYRIQQMYKGVRYGVTVRNLGSKEEAQSLINDYIRGCGVEPLEPRREDFIINNGNKSRKKDEECYLYYIRNLNNGNIKIGISNNPYKRVKNLQCGSSDPIEIIGLFRFKNRGRALKTESLIHSEFSDYRLKTTTKTSEWFRGETYCLLPQKFFDCEKMI